MITVSANELYGTLEFCKHCLPLVLVKVTQQTKSTVSDVSVDNFGVR